MIIYPKVIGGRFKIVAVILFIQTVEGGVCLGCLPPLCLKDLNMG